MPGFQKNIMGIGPICDADYKVTFTKDTVSIYNPKGHRLLRGWQKKEGPKLWRMSLLPKDKSTPDDSDAQQPTLKAFSAYDLPSVEAIIRYFHAAAGFPVRDTWLKASKAGKFTSWPGLTYQNNSKYCPTNKETIKGHMVQTRQHVRSTRPSVKLGKPPEPIPPEKEPEGRKNTIHIKTTHISKLYTDDTGRFPVISRKGNQYIMVAYHCDSNAIMVVTFKTRKDKARTADYNTIMQRLKYRDMLVNLQILENEASKEYEILIKDKWNINYQLVPSHIHRQNAAERAIQTFKALFISILAGVADDFPRRHWDQLLPQAELTLNLLRQANIQPEISAWTYLMGAFNYDATPLGPLGFTVMIHKKTSNQKSWDFRSKEGWSVGVSFEHYRCQLVIPADTIDINVSDTVELLRHFITTPTLTPEDRILHGINTLSNEIQDKPSATYETHIQAITKL